MIFVLIGVVWVFLVFGNTIKIVYLKKNKKYIFYF
jgi:hypothetical protein